MDLKKAFSAGLQVGPFAVNFENMKTHEMLAFYNRHTDRPVKRFESRSVALKRCRELWSNLQSVSTAKVMHQMVRSAASTGERPTMKDSLKLDRRIVMLTGGGEVWPNAYRMWCAYPALMTSAQQDRLTKQLYDAAKRGERLVVTVNDNDYCLLHVEGLKDWEAV